MTRRFTCIAFLLILASPLFAQEFRAAISGAITDPSGAPVPAARITAVETRTGTKTTTVSDSTGKYNVLFLLPGEYDLTARSQGFKDYVRKALHLGAGDHPILDVSLTLGDTSQTVEVTADVPLVNAENASVGEAITTKQVEDLPLDGRSPLMLAQLAIGVIMSPYNSTSTTQEPYERSNNFSIGGTPTQTSSILIDGSPNETWDNRSAYTPPVDAVQEVRVKAFDTDTAFGKTSGGTINMVLKTGTNSIHGTAYEFHKPTNMRSNNFFNNRNALPTPVTHYNQYGFTAGGPVVFPRLYNGRNKLFWFFSWERDVNSQPNTNFISVPTAGEKQGDFSQILKTDGVQLYDPYSAVLSNKIVVRTPYPNNQIPSSQFNPVALKLMKYFPAPNVSPGGSNTARPDGYDNYGATATATNDANSQLGRLDYNMTQKSRLALDVRHNYLVSSRNNYYNNASTGSLINAENWGTSVDEVYTVNATNILNLRLNYTFINENTSAPSEGLNPTDYGFPSYMATNSSQLALPYMYFATTSGYGALGMQTAGKNPSQSIQLFGTWTRVQNSHTLKLGFDGRQNRISTINYGASTGGFNFGFPYYVTANSSSATTVAMGQDMAQFLLGLPVQSFYDINTTGSWYSYGTAVFLQDDWRIKSNLTINFGARFDRNGPFNEKYGRTVNGFDGDVQNPIAPAVIAAYALHPSPQLPASQFKVNGGLTFPANGDTAVYQDTSHLVSPRVGLAWTPAVLRGKTVVRAGFGMFSAPATITYLSQNGLYGTAPILNQEGFSQQTSVSVGTTVMQPTANLNDPFPSGLLKPNGTAQGLLTFVGQPISFLAPEMKDPYSLRWNFGFQHTLSPNTMLEVLYIGNHAVHTPIRLTQLNGINPKYLSTKPWYDTSLVNALTTAIANPFYGISSNPAGATAQTYNFLAHYPQFPLGLVSGTPSGTNGILEQNLAAGSSYYHSLNVHILKRLSKGLSLTGNYIWSKLMEENTWLNDLEVDLRPEKRVGVFDHTHRGVVAFSYDLPVGRGRRVDLQSKWLNGALGGWHLNGIYTIQTGQPFAFMGTSNTTLGDYNYFGAPLNYHPREVDAPAFNTEAFTPPACVSTTGAARATCITNNQLRFHIRTFPTTFSSLRGDITNQVNASALKRFEITEKTYLQIRCEAFNLFNHPSFGFPNVAPTNSAFGLITKQSNQPRSIQLGARFVF